METQNENGKAIIQKKPTTLKEAIEDKKTDLMELLPDSSPFKTDRIIASFFLELEKNPKLKKCHPLSLLETLKNAVVDGLCFGTNRCYIIPYDDKATYQRSYLGIIDLLRRSKAVKKIGAGIVYENDKFELVRGSEERLVHIPELVDSARGEMHGAYMYAYTYDGEFITEYATKKEIDVIRSKSKNSPAWKDFYTEQAKKSVIKRGTKYLPLDPELAARLQEEDESEFNFNSRVSVSSDLNKLLAPTPTQDQEPYESESLEPEEVEAMTNEEA